MKQEQVAALRALAEFVNERATEDRATTTMQSIRYRFLRKAADYVLGEVIVNPQPHLGEVLQECSDWAFRVFGTSMPEGVMAHLLEEWQEWMVDPTNGEEAADVMMLMHHWFLLNGIDIRAELVRKLAINRARAWGKRQENGVVKHLEPPASSGDDV